MQESIRDIFYELGADVCGIANISRFESADKEYHPSSIWKECNSVIVFGISLPKSFYDIDSRLIYGHFNDISIQKVDELSFKAAKRIEEIGNIKALPIPCDGPYEYWKKEEMEGRGLISMKQAAMLSGLGSIGKNKLLINSKYGNRLTLGLLLADYALNSDELSADLCLKGCRLCIDNCPARAINEDEVNQMKCRTNTYKKTERGFNTVECYVCRKICPLRNGIKSC